MLIDRKKPLSTRASLRWTTFSAVVGLLLSVSLASVLGNSPAGAQLDIERMTSLQHRVDMLIRNYRVRGHIMASLDPLGQPNPQPPELDPAHWGFTEKELDLPFSTGTTWENGIHTLREIIDRMHATYCRSIGVQFMHIDDLVSAYDLVLKTDGLAGEVINIGSGETRSIRDVARRIGDHFSVPVEYGAARPGEIDRFELDSSKAAKLGFSPQVSFEEGLGRYLEWRTSQLDLSAGNS